MSLLGLIGLVTAAAVVAWFGTAVPVWAYRNPYSGPPRPRRSALVILARFYGALLAALAVIALILWLGYLADEVRL